MTITHKVFPSLNKSSTRNFLPLDNMGSVSDWNAGDDIELEALVVGGGLSGLYSLYKLRKEGIDAKIYEAGKELGGVWNYNRYPGARVDSEVPYYQYSIPEVYKTWTWSERFPGQEELLRYFDHVATTLNLYEHIAFEQNVCGSDFDQQSKKWTIATDTGKTVRCKYLIVAAGSSYVKHLPTFEGSDDYQGTLIHAAAFPDGGYDFTGKKAAVVGQGATGLQITQEASKKVDKLTVFIRTPNYALPMHQRRLSPEEQTQSMSIYDHLFRLGRESKTGVPYVSVGKAVKDVSEEEREAKFEELWARGGFNFNTAGFDDVLTDKNSNYMLYEFWRKKVASRISDPRKAEIFAPKEPPHPFSTKRPSLEQDYYECIDRPNVDVVSLNEVSIKSFDKTGIITSDGQHRDFDVVVLATGYDSITGSFTGMGLRDINGIDVKERWKEGVRTQLGMTIPGFPNMFMVYSPQGKWKHSKSPLHCPPLSRPYFDTSNHNRKYNLT